ncbi:MAG: 16S rRNA (cytosine(967)-C(5))-methyltransferase RsmB [Thermodesulfobacteriota bacterium]
MPRNKKDEPDENSPPGRPLKVKRAADGPGVRTAPPVRRTAVEILDRIDREGAYAEPLLDAALSGESLVKPRDRGLLTELVYGTIRMRGSLDWIIERLYRGKIAHLDRTLLNVIRTGLYQIWFTDRIPPFAVVNEAVAIARELSPASPGLVNALLRNAVRRKKAMIWPEIEEDPEQAIAVLHSHPAWLVRRLLAQFGIEETVAITRANNAIPPLALRVNTLKASRRKTMAALAGEGISAGPSVYSADGVIVHSPAPGLRETATYRAGWIRVQDEASQLIAALVAPRPGERILDLCAGAGGKSLHLAALMENRGSVTAVDRSPERLRMLRNEAGRLGAAVVQTRTGDAAAPAGDLLQGFDRVLLDAPCSGLGTLRRNPEIRWRLAPADIGACMRIQRRLLDSAAMCTRPGGRLVYSVCAVTPEENEIVIEDFLRRHPQFRLMPAASFPPGLIDAGGYLRTFPHRQGMDGFFAAQLMRIPSGADP